jgi:hypothetical protein
MILGIHWTIWLLAFVLGILFGMTAMAAGGAGL